MPRTIITGGAGFLGSHLVDRFLAEGHEVIAIDNLVTGSLANIDHIRSEKFRFIKQDVTEYLSTLEWAPAIEPKMTIAYHSACSMQHGQKITDLPKSLLRRAGFTVKDIPESHICCGSAGVYNIMQPELAGRLRERKQGNIARLKVTAVAAGNIGCIAQLSQNGPAPVVHTVELLDWACGGPKPAELA